MFLLDLHTVKSSSSSAKVRSVYNSLHQCTLVELRPISVMEERYGGFSGPTMQALRAVLARRGAKYLAIYDTDEYLLFQPLKPRAPDESVSVSQPPDLNLFLDRLFGRSGASAVYLCRWSFGTSGYVDMPDNQELPSFPYLTHREGDACRSKPAKRYGEIILRVDVGVSPGLFGHAFYGTGSVVLSDGTPMSAPEVAADHLRLPEHTPGTQPLSMNHYVTGAYSECVLKSTEGTHENKKLRNRMAECRAFHPGTHMISDTLLAAYATITLARRISLFPPQELLRPSSRRRSK